MIMTPFESYSPAVQVAMQNFARQLRRRRRTAGDPSYRDLERLSGIPKSTIGRMLSGDLLPRWRNILELLKALDADNEEIKNVWLPLWVATADVISPIDDEDEDSIDALPMAGRSTAKLHVVDG
jgi:predicted transcriptional regulator